MLNNVGCYQGTRIQCEQVYMGGLINFIWLLCLVSPQHLDPFFWEPSLAALAHTTLPPFSLNLQLQVHLHAFPWIEFHCDCDDLFFCQCWIVHIGQCDGVHHSCKCQCARVKWRSCVHWSLWRLVAANPTHSVSSRMSCIIV